MYALGLIVIVPYYFTNWIPILFLFLVKTSEGGGRGRLSVLQIIQKGLLGPVWGFDMLRLFSDAVTVCRYALSSVPSGFSVSGVREERMQR